MLKKAFYSLHRILGTILSILFLVWFLSGFVMIYHTFPKVSNLDRYASMEALPDNLIDVDSVFSATQIDSGILKLSLKSFAGNSYFEAMTLDTVLKVSADSAAREISNPTFAQIEQYAHRWNKAEIAKVDTLRKVEQWIPFGYLKKDFPIYKFYFSDDLKSQLYISSVTGEALQYTNKDNRFWAWVGAIPHWVYFTSLRQNSQLWSSVVCWLAGIGCIMCLTGIVVGIRAYVLQYRKRKKLKTPYKKQSYKWHHILGFFFGFFVLTFVFSGMMSLADVPQWMVKVHNQDLQNSQFMPEPVTLNNYKLDYRKVLEEYPDEVKSIEWASFGEIPLYKVVVGKKLHVIDASTESVRLLELTPEKIQRKLAKVHAEPMTIEVLSEYDNYYVGTSNHLPLPVYKVSVDDADRSTYYINPKNGNTRYYNTNSKIHRWTYQGLHSFEFGFLVKHPILWNIVMWTTMIGGTLVSMTGVWLGFKYIRRKLKKLKKYICSTGKKDKDICRKEK